MTWSGPAPEQAAVRYSDGEIFAEVSRWAGRDVPVDFPKKYLSNLQQVDLFNVSMSWNSDEFVRWQKRHGIEMKERPLEVFEQYVRGGNVIVSTLVQHPKVAEPLRFAACSVVLQRGVIIFRSGVETLFLRSYFHSAKDSQDFVNFVPKGALEMTFKSDGIWFPLALSGLIDEPASYAVLDVLTESSLAASEKDLAPFKAESLGEVVLEGEMYHLSRLTARLESGRQWPDLRLSAY